MDAERSDTESVVDVLDSLLSQWPGVVFRQRPDLGLIWVRGQLEELTGCTAERWLAEPGVFWSLLHELDEENFRRELARCAKGGPGVHHQFRLRHASSGRVRHVAEFRLARQDAGGSVLGYDGFWLDITRQTLAERRLAGAAWKETLGLLTLGLAHDFNNVLAGVLGLSDSLLMQVPAGDPSREGLMLVKRKTQEAAQSVQRIGQLHRAKTGSRGYHDLHALVAESLDLLGKVIPQRVRVSSRLHPEPLALYVDPVELQQVLIALAMNAADAMPEGGTLIFTTRRLEELPVLEHSVGVAPRLPAVSVAVTDTGCGIKPRFLPLLFEPFFTTKPMNRGSGLGLYNARLFVEKHHGSIAVESKEGAGTTFRLWLPEADFTEADQALQTRRQQRRGLLLVGRPGPLLQSTAELLRLQNYLVVPAGSDAEDMLRSEDYPFDGALLLAEPADPRPLLLAQFIRLHKLPLKIIVKAVTSTDELSADLRRKADLVIPADAPEGRALELLAEILDGAIASGLIQ